MIRNLLRAARPSSSPAATPGDGLRIYAIGDVHGCLAELDRLLAMIAADDEARTAAGGAGPATLIFLGDLVDRGPDSAGVLSRLIELARSRPGTRFLKGNHEEVFLRALSADREALRLFCRVGGRETVLSYGIDAEGYERMDYAELHERMAAIVPAEHRTFMDAFEDVIVAGDYAFVHAGIRPEVPLDAQRGADLRWIRNSFLDYRRAHPKIIVHGHTITDDVDRRPNRIGVDTGAYASGRLSAIGLEGADVWVLQT
ncbi:MAG: metallophosphoesterase family protein [Sphingomonas adhaesiva]|uniref:metallophosphoesterase family protein n=1 Tax=Sphingomonas adhaesiva TaxID=28212 RepID=UPI002FF4AE10